MGKGAIISSNDDGLYSVTVEYDTTAIAAKIVVLDAKITECQTIIDDPESTESEIAVAKIYQLSAQKQKSYLENADKVPQNFNTTAWCADYTTNLTGSVGTIEIGREIENGINIQPGYNGNAVYNSVRDGQLMPLMAQTGPATFYNLAMLPGFQKWKSMFRYGTITDIDYDEDTCSVTMGALTSSQQGLNINQEYVLAGISIVYMECNSAVFEIGDQVVVKFILVGEFDPSPDPSPDSPPDDDWPPDDLPSGDGGQGGSVT